MSSDESLRRDIESQDHDMTANKTAEAEPEQMADSPANETAADETASSESVESSEPLEQPRPAEQPAASAGEPEAASSQTGEPAADRRAEETPGEQRRRVRLNPTVNQAEAKPRPSIAATELTVSDAKAAPSGVAETSPETPSSTRGAETRPPQPQERQTGSPAETEASSQGEPAAPVGSKPETAGHSEAELQTPPAEEAAVEEDVSAGQADQPAAKAASPTAPVELPPKVENLDADLEAEIAAAMAGGTLDAVAGGPQTPEAPAVEQPSEESLEAGTRLKGKVESISDDNVFLELGYRFPGVVQRRQFEAGKPPELGQILEVTVDRVDPEDGLILVNLPRGMRKVAGNWDAVATGQVVDCMVTKTNKGGLEVTVSSLRGFLPASQVDLGFVSDLEPFVGQKLRVQITEVNPKKRNLVVSRRAYLQIERQEAEEALWKTLEVGQTFTGKVKTLKDYGAFVDIGGVDGFLHVGEISWTRIRHPSDVLQEGQQVEVQVISLDAEKKKIGLGMRQLIQNPWTDVTSKYPVGSTVSGRVTRTMDFGAFVELEPGLEGLIHISELEYKRVRKVTDVLQVDQEVDVKVLETDPDRKRISLSLKALQEKPEEAKRPDEELAPEREEPPAAVSKRREPLRGGTGSQSGKGGLFGNPRDYS